MKRIIVFLLSAISIVGLTSCISDKENLYVLEIVDNFDLIMHNTRGKYKEGEIIEIHLDPSIESQIGIKDNDKIVNAVGSASDDCKIIEYVMPNKDTLIYTHLNGYIINMCLDDEHQWDEGVIEVVPGTLKEERVYTCSLCGDTKKEVIYNPTVEDFVSFKEIKVPYDYFNNYVLIEKAYDDIGFIRLTNIIGLNPNADYEFGQIDNWYKNNELFHNLTSFQKARNIDGIIYKTKEFQSKYFYSSYVELSQEYSQSIDNIALSLDLIEETMYVNNYEIDGTETFMVDVMPRTIFDLPTNSIKYEYGIYGDLGIVKISGEYIDSRRIELYNVSFDVTYIIRDNTIIAFLFNEKASNDSNTEYTTTTDYCIPYDGEINLISDEIMEKLSKVKYD